jgi:catalase
VVLSDGQALGADHKVDGGPSILFDAVAILPSAEGGAALANEAAAVNWLRDAFAHLKVIAYSPTARPIFAKGGLSDADTDGDAGLIALSSAAAVADFIKAASAGRIWAREPQVRKLA